MAVHTTRAQTTQPHVAAPSAPAEAVPVHRSCTDPAVRALAGCTQRPAPRRLEGVKAAASVMGWVLWILLALTMAAFLTFVPSML